MENDKKVLISAIGINVYDEVTYHFQNKQFTTPLPLAVIAASFNVDEILILGTKEALDEERPHYEQLLGELNKYHLQEKFHPLEIGALNTREEFWQAFQTITAYPSFKRGALELFVDLTFGYRIQPMLIFLASYFLNETVPGVKIKKVFYGMNMAKPPHILDMTELVYLLDWLKSAQMFVQGGSAKSLVHNISQICGYEFQEVAASFSEFADAYAFNYVSDLKQKAANFQKEYGNKNFKRSIRSQFPVFELLNPFLARFINSFSTEDELAMQLGAAHRNFEDAAYSRSVIILREVYITFFMSILNLNNNDDRKRVEEVLINRVYFALFNEDEATSISETDKREAQETYRILVDFFGENMMREYYRNWGAIREMRNNSGHIRILARGEKKKYYTKFERLKEDLKKYLESSKNLFEQMDKKFNSDKDNANLFRKTLLEKLKDKAEKKLFVIVNEGVHPILPQLKAQFGGQINAEVLTSGNVDLDAETEIANKCMALAQKYHDYAIYLVPSGYPYMAVAAYNSLQQTLARHPVWLQFDRESGQYKEKNLDPRKLLDEK